MKALAIVIAVLLVLAHPAAAAAVVVVGLAACGALVWLIRRTASLCCPHWRTA